MQEHGHTDLPRSESAELLETILETITANLPDIVVEDRTVYDLGHEESGQVAAALFDFATPMGAVGTWRLILEQTPSRGA